MSLPSDRPLLCRGVRGATTAEADTEGAILAATRELLTALVQANGIAIDDIASIFFTVTPDLTAVHPARAARELGWTDLALFTSQEMDVPGSLRRAIRILIHWNTILSAGEIRHIYIRGAETLRPDRAALSFSGGED